MPLVTRGKSHGGVLRQRGADVRAAHGRAHAEHDDPDAARAGSARERGEVTTINNWIAGRLSRRTCGTTTGAGGGGGTVTPDPLGATRALHQGTMWTGGNNGSSVMNPGPALIRLPRERGRPALDHRPARFIRPGTSPT